jgi:RNA recognition motif-containing protein
MELEPEIINFATPKDDSTVLISNFSSKTSEDDLFEIVSQYGLIFKCVD